MDEEKRKSRKKLLKGSLQQYKKKYPKPRKLLEKLYVLYADFEEIKHIIDRLPGGYGAFSAQEKNFSNSSLTGLRNDIEELIFNLEDRPIKEKAVEISNYSFFEKMNKFINVGNGYIDKTREHYQLNTIWIMLFFNPIIKIGFGEASVGKSILRIDNKGECRLQKIDSDLEPIETNYTGSYKRLTKLNEDCILSFDLTSDQGRSINIIVGFRSARDKGKFGIGTFNQYDGKKVHSGRLLLVETSTSFDDIYHYKNFVENNYKDQGYPFSQLMLKSENYICAINKYENNDLIFGSTNYVVETNKFRDVKSKFIDPPLPMIFLGSNLSFLHLVGVKPPFKKKSDDFHQETKEPAIHFSEIYKRIKKESKYDIRPFGPVNYPAKFSALKYTTFFIYLNDSTENSSLSMTFLGAALQACKYVLILYQEDSLDDNFLEFFDESKTKEFMGSIYKLRPYKNLKNDRLIIENHILSFIEYNKDLTVDTF